MRGVQEEGGLITMGDLAKWKVRIEEPLSTTYKGIQVYKLPIWQQGPVMLQALNILENADLKAMGYNSPRYIHTLYQAMNLAYADRDFYYGDPYFPPAEPVKGLLSKEYAKARYGQINWTRNDSTVKPGDPYPYQGGTNRSQLLARLDQVARPDSTGALDPRLQPEPDRPTADCPPVPSACPPVRLSAPPLTPASTRAPPRSKPPTRRAGSCR